MIETPKVGCDTFIFNEKNEVLLIQSSDNELWALPGGYNDLGESPVECALREYLEETGYAVSIINLLGIFSSLKYSHTSKSINRKREICHILFLGQVLSGVMSSGEETRKIKWFSFEKLPAMSDGHCERVEFGFRYLKGLETNPFFQ